MKYYDFLTKAENEGLYAWLRDYCGTDMDTLEESQVRRAYGSWQDELFWEANTTPEDLEEEIFQRLKADPNFVVPEETHQRMMDLIMGG